MGLRSTRFRKCRDCVTETSTFSFAAGIGIDHKCRCKSAHTDLHKLVSAGSQPASQQGKGLGFGVLGLHPHQRTQHPSHFAVFWLRRWGMSACLNPKSPNSDFSPAHSIPKPKP